MDPKSILDLLLNSGQQMARQGGDTTGGRKAGGGEDRQQTAIFSDFSKGALSGGALGLLLGTKSGRKLGGSALKLGTVAALGGLAYKAYQNWRVSQDAVAPADPGPPVDRLAGTAASARSQVLLRAMISAAKADGHIDEAETTRIRAELARLGMDQETLSFFQDELSGPPNPRAIAALADSTEAASEIYLASRLVLDLDSAMERGYLEDLASHLGLAPGLVQQLESQAEARDGAR